METIVLNSPMIDYLTLTSYSSDFTRVMRENVIQNLSGQAYDVVQRGYKGTLWVFLNGTAFLGTGKQRGEHHSLIKISGELAHLMLDRVIETLQAWQSLKVECSRLDYQITVKEPEGWSQWDYLNRMQDRGYTVGYPTPSHENGVKLETVYIGVRTKSDRFYRVYVKLMDDAKTKLLRVEVELKKRRSRAVWLEIMQGVTFRSVLDCEIDKFVKLDSQLYGLVIGKLLYGKVVRVGANESNIASWLVDIVFPAMDRFLMSDSSDKRKVIFALYALLEDRGL